MFSPDVQGPMSKQTLELIRAAKPTTLMIGGPPFYLRDLKVDEAQLQKAADNLARLIAEVPVTILEHHALRDEHGQQRMKHLQVECQTGHEVMTSAEYAGLENSFLESRRKELYVDDPPSEAFKRWMNTLQDQKECLKPPT
jgi:predicted metallo-beta-lactamase superfamily hydrolase